MKRVVLSLSGMFVKGTHIPERHVIHPASYYVT